MVSKSIGALVCILSTFLVGDTITAQVQNGGFGSNPQNRQTQGGVQNNGQARGRTNAQAAGNRGNGAIQNAIQRSQAPQIQLKAPPRQSPEIEKFVDDVLKYWEFNSAKIERYRCQFSRYVYDETFLNLRDPKTRHIYAKTLATGIVRFEKPDKGMYETQNIWLFKGEGKPGQEPDYQKAQAELLEKWICDGKSIFEFKPTSKQIIERTLPPEMQGEQISDGPLPFMFGVKAAEMKERYWIRDIRPADSKGEYWLEATPKKIEDARNYLKVEVILDEKDFLPKFLTVYENNHDPARGKTRKTSFEFSKREYNWNGLKDNILNWKNKFYRPKTPSGWKLVKDPGQRSAAIPNNRQPANRNQRTQFPQRK